MSSRNAFRLSVSAVLLAFLSGLAPAIAGAAAPPSAPADAPSGWAAAAPGDRSVTPLTFQRRVEAHRALERVRWSHLAGERLPFDQTVPQALLERKVRDALRQSAALERFWSTPITGGMLRAELERMVRGSRMPERLRELLAALGNDPLLAQEALARPALAARLARSFFEKDERIHAAAREEAVRLREALLEGRLDPSEPHPALTVVRLVRGDEERREGPATPEVRDPGSRAVTLPAEEFDRTVAAFPVRTGGIGELEETSGAFVTRVLLGRGEGEALVASAVTPKRTWEDWWAEVEPGLDDPSVEPPAADGTEAILAEAASSGSCSDDTWVNGSLDDLPDPRVRTTAVWTGSRVIVWGGFTGSITLNTGGLYDPATDTWEKTALDGAPAPRYFHTAVWTGSRMIVWGGRTDPGGTVTDTGGRYDPVANAWTDTSRTGAPEPRRGHTAVWTGSRMVVWGGDTLLDPTGGRYDPVSDTWTPTTQTGAPSMRTAHTAVWTGTRMIIWGGVDNFFPGTLQNTGSSYDPVADSWTPISTTGAPSARRDHTAVWTGSLMIVWGGNAGETPFLRTGGRYDPSTNLWSATTTNNAPESRTQHGAVWSGTVMIVWGGSGAPGYLRSGGRYLPTTNTWTATTLANAPSAREGFGIVWTGSRMIVWGGTDDRASANTGGRYDPAADSWTATSTGGAPLKRDDHSAVWTGSEMIVWGGFSEAMYLNSGGRYDPATDTWAPTATGGAPAARLDHAAVWTGSRMVVWGGIGTAYFNTGGRYDPVANAWTPTSTTGAPAARRGQTGVWTGSRVVVWGGWFFDIGNGQTTYFDSGGRYDPVADTWAPVSLSGAPPARRNHTAVWTGSRMIVWGGWNASSFFNGGGRYDPAGDSWTGLTTTGAPSARQDHSALWTGSEMIVWGGRDASDVIVSTGGLYDPAADSWRTTTMAGAPQPRLYHRAAWNGSEMIVWGGWVRPPFGGLDEFLDTGGRYDPAEDLWDPTATAGAASARRLHTAVHASDRMIVWGGNNGTFGPTSTGGAYCACARATFYPDTDGDGFGDPGAPLRDCTAPPGYVSDGSDCDDAQPGAWAPPSETRDLMFTDETTLTWSPPMQPGAASVLYDLLRSDAPADFTNATVCVATDTPATSATDATIPAAGEAFFYLARAGNSCPAGEGDLGSASDGTPRTGRGCP